jgi:hypothetical protein
MRRSKFTDVRLVKMLCETEHTLDRLAPHKGVTLLSSRTLAV